MLLRIQYWADMARFRAAQAAEASFGWKGCIGSDGIEEFLSLGPKPPRRGWGETVGLLAEQPELGVRSFCMFQHLDSSACMKRLLRRKARWISQATANPEISVPDCRSPEASATVAAMLHT